MEHTHSTPDDRPLRIPRIVWMIGGGLLIALVAVVVFNVPLNTVASIGFFVLLMGSHLFMHGGHGDHSQHNHPPTNAANTDGTPTADGAAAVTPSTDQPARHSGGCH
ncbi:hypothetical protein ANRL4_02077 [Anaerolineae bacterium]|nr:hypothetical protein ANRL4_02077 [Anaerolineae bacterium]